MKPRQIILAVVIALLVVVILIARPALVRYDTILGGMWVADPGFLKKSGLADMQLFISPTGGSTRQGYLIMKDTSQGFVANQALEFHYSFGWLVPRIFRGIKSALRPASDAIAGTATIEMDTPGEGDPFPTDLKMTLSLAEMSMTLFNDEKVFAYLYRDPVASHAANLAYE